MTKNGIAVGFLAGLTALGAFLCYLLVAPFLKPIVAATVFAIVSYPLNARIAQKIRNANASAAITTAMLILAVTSACIFLGRSIVVGLRDIYESLIVPNRENGLLGVFALGVIDQGVAIVGRYVNVPAPVVQSTILNHVERSISYVLAGAVGMFGSAAALVWNTLICFFVLFFMLRDGQEMLHHIAIVLPLRRDLVARLYRCIGDTLNLVVWGTMAIAALQGVLAGIAFWFLGVRSAALWGTITGLCSLLPVVGTGIVLLPAIAMLAASGAWFKAGVLLVWSIAVIHPVDDLVRPYFIGARLKFSTLYLFIALLGGIERFGPIGLFVGPVILALAATLFSFLKEEKRLAALKEVESRDRPHIEPQSGSSNEVVAFL